MAVRFILGRAGSGKTRYFLERIQELAVNDPLGPPIYWLLPKQATFQAERELTCALGGFARVRVVSFEQLGKDILTDCGDVGIPQVTALGRQMVVGHLLRKHQGDLRFYSASARRPGLAAELDSTFGEFERAGIDAQALQELMASLTAGEDPASSLRDKLHDINLLLTAYNAHIGQERLDPQRRLKRILERVNQCSMLKRATLFVDDFFDFSGYEQKLLVAIVSAAERAEIALLLDPDNPAVTDELSTFHRTERTYRLLRHALIEAAVTIEPPLLLREGRRFTSLALAGVERHLFTDGDREHFPTLANEIEFLDAPDTRTEIDAVARGIRKALREGLRLRDIAVLARDLDNYQEIIDASFREHQFLPYFADRRRTAGHHPLLQFVRSCILIALRGWPHDAIMTLLKTGLTGISEDQADELENYCLLHRIHGKMWMSKEPWGFGRELISGGEDGAAVTLAASNVVDLSRMHVVSRLEKFMRAVPAKKEISFRTIIVELFTLLEEFGVRNTLSLWMQQAEQMNELEQRSEHEQVWSKLVELFEHMGDVLGEEKVGLADFLEVLDNGLESFDLALTPPTIDQILIGQIDRTRTPAVKLVFVVGLNEGEFPRLQREDGVLWDSERRSLRKRNIDLDPETERRLLDERLLAYVAFTRSSQRLVISRSLSDEGGRTTNPSPFWNELRRLCSDAPIEHTARPSQTNPDSIGTPRQLVTALMRWARNGGAKSEPWSALYQWLAEHDCCDDAIDTMRFRAWKALGYDNAAKLSAEVAGRLFKRPLQAGTAQIESFAACPFQHFLRYGLHLQEREEPDVTSLDLSRAYHQVLENLVSDILKSRQDWCKLEPVATAELIRFYTAEIGRTLRGELMLSSARNRYLLEHIERTLAQAIESQCEASRRGKYRPAFASLRFGEDQTLPAHPVDTPRGNEVYLRGKIDRVDVHEGDHTFTVADYKLSISQLALDRVFHGLSLQLLVYLLVVQENAEQLVGHELRPAAAFFLQLLRSHQSVDHPSEAMAPNHPDFHLRHKPRGIIHSGAVQGFDGSTREGHSPVVQFFLKKDGQPGNRHITDIAEENEFTALLQHVQRRIGELADELLAGDVRVYPHSISRQTPCPHCDYRSVCRFEPGIDKYHFLQPMKRDDVLRAVTDGGIDGQ